MKKGLEGYYRLHACIYDMTRWSFLFGREAIIDLLAKRCSPAHILEVGCGTGKNLVQLAGKFPGAEITGLDLSPEMLKQAVKKCRPFTGRIHLIQKSYDGPIQPGTFDIVLFSYSLSMMESEWRTAVESAAIDLVRHGRIAVADFHNTPVSTFRSWMQLNHVRMQGHLLPGLSHFFTSEYSRIRAGYAGIWNYLIFLGRPKNQSAPRVNQ